jgi:hypothetical protein
MRFALVIYVWRVSNGYHGTVGLPTVYVEAPTKKDAIDRTKTIVSHMPRGTTYTLVEA